MKGFIIYPTYDIINEETVVQLFGRLENGQSFLTINKLKPYFFIKTKDVEKIRKYLAKYEVEETNLKNFNNECVAKISSNNHLNLKKLHPFIRANNIEIYEEDIKPHYRFMIDNELQGSIDIEGDYETAEKFDRIYKEPKIKPSDFIPKLKILSIDTESDHKGKLFCIGLYSENFKKNFIITDKKLENAESCKTEEECLIKFKEAILKFDPDIITGWNLIDFDMVYLKNLFKKNKIKFDIGRTNEEIRIRIKENFIGVSTADIPGRQILDGFNLIRDPFIQEPH